MRQEYMRRAIELAKRGLGRVNPIRWWALLS